MTERWITPMPSSTKVDGLEKLRAMVLASVVSDHTKRNYAKALDDLFAFVAERREPLSRALLMDFREGMITKKLSPSTVNVRLSAVRKMIAEARSNGFLGALEAAELADIPNVREHGTRLGNWLTREQAKELLTVPDRSKLKGKRDYAILAILVGCALRRAELASLLVADIQQREGRWVIADMRGKGGRIRTVAVPFWIKKGIDEWTSSAMITDGNLFRSIRKERRKQKKRCKDQANVLEAQSDVDSSEHESEEDEEKVKARIGKSLSDWAVWSVVESSAKAIGIEHFGAHNLRRTCAKLCRKAGGDLEQIKFLLGHASIQTTERYLGSEQEIALAVNDNIGL